MQNTAPENSVTFEFYDGWNGNVYACATPMGFDGIFCLYPSEVEQTWQFLAPQSPHWDAAHQAIYRNFRADKIRDAAIIAALPSLPQLPPGPHPTRASYELPASPILLADFPKVAQLLQSHGGKIPVYVILSEDTYETMMGDGRFHDLHRAFENEQDAQNYMDEVTREISAYKYYLREMEVGQDEAAFCFPNFELETYDHYAPKDVLRMIETRLTENHISM